MDAGDRLVTWIVLVIILVVQLTTLVRVDELTTALKHPTAEAPHR